MLQSLKNRLIGNALPCYVISRQPLILVSYWEDFLRDHRDFEAACADADGPVYVLAMLGWHRETAARVDPLVEEVRGLAAAAPRFTPIFLANSPLEATLLGERGLRVSYCHQNAFLDEHRYHVTPRLAKRYDALYVARITPFKRHQLAAGITSLRLVGSWHGYESSYRDAVMRQLAHAHWREQVWSPLMFVEMNRARTGLCLSAEEGAMFVSTEYLLCGLPVVSTPNKGGRDHLFPPEFALTVEPTVPAVADGVARQIARHFDPRAIREATLALMRPHRDNFVALVQSLYEAEGCDRDFSSEWPQVYRHKLGIRCRVPPTVTRRRGLLRPG